MDDTADICNGCMSYASKGTYAICTKCNKISFAYIDIEATTKRTIYSKTCLQCSGEIPKHFYELEEEAKREK
jgi:hypothetical protein